jgi:prephenate dehydrogenase
MRIAILGFGLIGGSLARALRLRGAGHELIGWSPSGTGPARAVVDGVLARSATSIADALPGADLVLVGAPPLAAIELVETLPGLLADAGVPDTLVTDVVSTKARLVEAADAAGLRFVGGHPMAGREVSGYDGATDDLFVGRPWVVVPGAHATAADVATVEELARTVGAEPIRMSAAAHDAAVAAISHLPLAVSAALAEAVTGGEGWATARRLAASGWRDTTRVARGDVAMGTGIAATNAAALADGIRQVRDILDAWLAALDGGDAAPGPDVDAIRAHLAAARGGLTAE